MIIYWWVVWFLRIASLIAALIVISVIISALQQHRSVVLPNGLIAQNHIFLGPRILSSNGEQILIEGYDNVCFTENYIEARGMVPIDVRTGVKVAEHLKSEAYEELNDEFGRCDGYIRSRVEISFLLSQVSPHQRFSCSARNFVNPNLKNKAWLDRPCDPYVPFPEHT